MLLMVREFLFSSAEVIFGSIAPSFSVITNHALLYIPVVWTSDIHAVNPTS